MDNQQFQTLKAKRPLTPRPVNGFAAWQATLGHIARHFSQDAVLSVKVQPSCKESLIWSALVTWGDIQEKSYDHASFSDVLSSLWTEVENKHIIFGNSTESSRRPIGYDQNEWLDIATQETLHRLIWAAETVFKENWTISFDYRPVDITALRVRVILVGGDNLSLEVCGSSLLDACRDLFRRSIPLLSAQSGIMEHLE